MNLWYLNFDKYIQFMNFRWSINRKWPEIYKYKSNQTGLLVDPKLLWPKEHCFVILIYFLKMTVEEKIRS